MNLRRKIINTTIQFITKNLPEKNKEELECIEYGIEIFLINISKMIILFLIALLLGILKYFLICFISINALKLFSGGVHAKKSSTCLLMSIIVFFIPIYASYLFQFNLTSKILIFIITFISFIKYAPADLEEKPYVNSKNRKILKILSCVMAIILFLVSIFLTNPIYSNIVFLSIVINSLLITPYTYKILKRRYRNYEYYNFNSN